MSRFVPARLGTLAVLAGLGTAGAVSLLVPAGSAAGTAGVRPLVGSSDPAVVQLLRRAAQAAERTAYSGVQYLCSWGSDGGSTSVVVEVAHYPGKGSMVSVRPTPSTGAVRIYGNEPPSPSRPDGGQDLTGARGQALALLERQYEVDLAEPEEVAGRRADVVDVRRPDGSLAARLWLDTATGLLLRREVTDRHGRMTRASSFVDLRVGTGGVMPVAEGSRPLPRPWARKLAATDLSRLSKAGWAVPQRLPGGLELFDARSGTGTDGGEVVHLAFSDGLSTVSVFEQKGRLDPRQLGSWRRAKLGGARVYLQNSMHQRVVWASGGKVFTVLADAPQDTVEAVIHRLPHAAPSTGVLHRLGRGVARVGSWFNPFA